MHKIACCYHPVTVVFLDDEANFLEALTAHFPMPGVDISSFTDPAVAISKVLLKNQDVTLLSPHYQEAETPNECVMGIKISEIHQLIYQHARFKSVAVVVVDYNMPTMTGIKFCEQVKDVPILKIMLTAEQDKSIVIDAFNAGVINKFIPKHAKNLKQDLMVAIEQLKEEYFFMLSKMCLDSLEPSVSKLLNQENFLKIFTQVMSQAKAVEYYLMDNQGSFLFLDAYGKPTWLFVKNEQEFQQDVEMLKGLEAPASLRGPVENREKMLILLSKEDHHKSVLEWDQYLFSATQLDEKHYYAIHSGPSVSSIIDWNRVEPYRLASAG